MQCAPQSGFIKTPQVLCTLNTVPLTSGVGLIITFTVDNLHVMYCCLVNFLIFGTQAATTRPHVLRPHLKTICVTIYCHQELRFCDVGIKCTYTTHS